MMSWSKHVLIALIKLRAACERKAVKVVEQPAAAEALLKSNQQKNDYYSKPNFKPTSEIKYFMFDSSGGDGRGCIFEGC
jgi:hypothetical protein